MQRITLTVDGKKVGVPSGSTILDAAQAAGVRIPTLCHDNKLHPFGGCRICLVEVEGASRAFVPSCAALVKDGMVVRTSSPAIIEARRMVLELLLIKHPLECPSCDKSGECQLQDLVHEYGLGPSRFDAKKEYLPPDFGNAVIERHMSRCILCGKCARICDEQNGVGEWAFTRRGSRTRISTDFDRPLDCEFCGECVEICPVGALTSKQYKYKAHSWNLTKTGSVCNYCGCGCTINYETRDKKIVRTSPMNNNYLCVKGRYGWDALHHADRLATPKMRVYGRLVDCTWEDALSMVATNLKVLKNKHGASSIGGLGSVRTTNEENYLFQKFMRAVVGTNNVDMLARLKIPKGLNTSFFSGELGRIAEHDVILALDSAVGEINPLTGIEIVRAITQHGRTLVLVNDGDNKFNKIAGVVIPAIPEKAVSDLVAALKAAQGAGAVQKAAAILKASKSVAVIIPSQLRDSGFRGIRELSGLLKNVTFYPVVPRSNFQGALDMGVLPSYYPGYQKIDANTIAAFSVAWDAVLPETPGLNAVEMMHAIASGNLSALYVMGDDPVGSDPDFARSLRKLEFLVVQDIFMSETAKMADVVLPAAGCSEKVGTFTNLERRLQQLDKAEEPHGTAKRDWEIIRDIAKKMGTTQCYTSAADIMKEIRSVAPLYANLSIGACWQREQSPLAGTDGDLSLASGANVQREVITGERLLFSSGMSITRSPEMGTIRRNKK
jgi:predicted molibdopterin-dependent oxidoreductase YjgC